MRVACVLITHLRAKVEMGRRPHLRDLAVMIVDRSKGRPLVVDHFPAAAGVAPGMTLEQALSRNSDSPVLESGRARLPQGVPPGAPLPAGSQRPGGGG